MIALEVDISSFYASYKHILIICNFASNLHELKTVPKVVSSLLSWVSPVAVVRKILGTVRTAKEINK